MKVATVSIAGERRVGQITPDGSALLPFDLPMSEAQDGILALIRRNGAGLPPTLSPVPLDRVAIEAPIPQPRRNIFCVGKNYHEHAHEFAKSGFDSSAAKGAVPSSPIMFSKVPESVVPCGSAVIIDPEVSQAVDYEAELAVIIGKGGRGIRAKEAFDHVWGYTIVNDVTARDLQRTDGQWTRAKGFDTFCPVGPRVVSNVDWRGLEIRCRVNGELRQQAKATEMHFPIPFLLSYISGIMTLEPGDLIATGTPAGVGPLKDGDVVEVEIPGIGVLSNPIRDEGTA